MIEQAAEALDDCQAEPEPAAAVAIRTGELIELDEYVAPMILGDAGPAVPDFDAQELAAAATADHDSAIERIAHRVRDQIEEYSLEQNEIAANPGDVRKDA